MGPERSPFTDNLGVDALVMVARATAEFSDGIVESPGERKDADGGEQE
jgi:hypothetical protein